MRGQSVMQPLTAEYWHIGAMTMRLANSRAPTRNGLNSLLIPILPILGVTPRRSDASLGSSGAVLRMHDTEEELEVLGKRKLGERPVKKHRQCDPPEPACGCTKADA